MYIVDALGLICFSKKTTHMYVDLMVCKGFPCDSPSPLLQNLPKQTISDTRIHPKTTRQRWKVEPRPTPEQFSWVESLDWMMIEAPKYGFIMSQYISSFLFRSFFFAHEGVIGSKWLMLWDACALTWDQSTYNHNGSEWRVWKASLLTLPRISSTEPSQDNHFRPMYQFLTWLLYKGWRWCF